jgi:hypothetical protein
MKAHAVTKYAVVRILALALSLSLPSCSPESASKTAKPSPQPENPQKDQHRAACLPQAGGEIICQ